MKKNCPFHHKMYVTASFIFTGERVMKKKIKIMSQSFFSLFFKFCEFYKRHSKSTENYWTKMRSKAHSLPWKKLIRDAKGCDKGNKNPPPLWKARWLTNTAAMSIPITKKAEVKKQTMAAENWSGSGSLGPRTTQVKIPLLEVE